MSADKAILDTINEMLKTKYSYEEIKNKTVQELGIDSISYIRLLVVLEEKLKIQIDDKLLKIDGGITIKKIEREII